ncbi:MAG: ABC transporter ATP-binding protein [Salinisphaera sp.]|jgi:spermidine/putrescine transport system ATP-binding protein|nr:ABC transporter ATP-binding protein [Salinisphaera sp.]
MAAMPNVEARGQATFDCASEAAMAAETKASRATSTVRLIGLTKTFSPNIVALKGVDLDIPGGEFFTLLGPSGCGKTTLLRMIAGLEHATGGEIEIGGRAVTHIPAHKRNVNTVFQSYALFPHLSVRDNIGFGLRMCGVKKPDIQKRVIETAKFIKISELLDRKIDQLSGGQKQRIALARALINEPDVLLLDEPLSALDAGLRGELQIELLRIQRRLGMTFIFVTHDQQEAMVMSDRIAVLSDGHIQQVGGPKQLYERPDNLFVAHFMGHSNLFPIQKHDANGVYTELGRIVGRFESGTHMLIRPETVTLTPGQSEGDNHLSASVVERIYRGSVAEYRLNCGATELVAKCNNCGQDMFEVGDTVTVVVETDGLVTLNE